MRTTLNLDDDVVMVARALADSERRSLGQVISDLARKGLKPREAPLADEDGFPVFSVDAQAPVITGDMVEAGLDDL
ncbi:MAG TPA: hypothetical protein VKV80_04465 [Streptosporangiaceae bacterium]|nr:hypothetical protein [Streptosporangiaceae bacterium]